MKLPYGNKYSGKKKKLDVTEKLDRTFIVK